MGKASWLVLVLLLVGVLVGFVHAETAEFTSSGSWEVPAGVTSANVTVVGGGGGGQGGYGDGYGECGGKGGSAGTTNSQNGVSVTPGQTITITIGSGGSGGAGYNNGGNGGQSVFDQPSGTDVTAAGGNGGTGDQGGTSGGAGANGYGSGTYASAGGSCTGASGGAAGTGRGAGGGGGAGRMAPYYCAASGGAGASGYIFITYTVSSTPPVADFSANVTSGVAPLTVAFTDTSTGSPTSWCWDIDNSGNCDYTTQNCEHTYSSAGTYTVNLTATNDDGSDSEVKASYITAILMPGTLSPHIHYTTFPTPPAGTYTITTYPAEDVGDCEATLKGGVSAATEVWFEYGFTSGSYSYATEHTSCSAGNHTETVDGIPLIPGKTVYYRAVSPYGYGEEENFTTLARGATAFPTSTYSVYVTQFFDTDGNWTAIAEVIWAPYIAKFGTLFFSILIGVIFLGLAAKQGSSFIPLLVVFIVGIPIFVMLAPEFLWLAQALIILGVGIAIYHFLTQPR